MAGMSTTEYANRRDCSDSYVRRLRREGRLKLTADGKIDPEASDKLLAVTDDPSRGGARGGSQDGPDQPFGADPTELSLREAMRRERLARARLAELELGEEAKALVRSAKVQRDVFTLARQALERLRGIPSKLRHSLAAASDASTCEALLEVEIAKVCQELQAAASAMQTDQAEAQRATA